MSVLSTERTAPTGLDLQGIDEMLRRAAAPDPKRLDDLLDKAKARVGLALSEVAELLSVSRSFAYALIRISSARC